MHRQIVNGEGKGSPSGADMVGVAIRTDVDAIVRLLSNDPLGAKREQYESPLPKSYDSAFDTIEADPHNQLVVADMDGAVVGTLQLTIIPYLTYRGRSRAQIEAVRIHADQRGKGLGAEVIRWAIDRPAIPAAISFSSLPTRRDPMPCVSMRA